MFFFFSYSNPKGYPLPSPGKRREERGTLLNPLSLQGRLINSFILTYLKKEGRKHTAIPRGLDPYSMLRGNSEGIKGTVAESPSPRSKAPPLWLRVDKDMYICMIA